MEWNVVVTIYPEGFRRAVRAIAPLGAVERTPYHNVLLARATDSRAFLDTVEKLTRNDPQLYDSISRVAPAMQTFTFGSVDEFEEKAKAGLLEWLPNLRGRSFHVRLRRRGMDDPRNSTDVERHLGDFILGALERQGTEGSISFSDPDAVIAIDIVKDRAGLALWTREELSRYKMLRPD